MTTRNNKRSISFCFFCFVLLIVSGCQPIAAERETQKTDMRTPPATAVTQTREPQTAEQNPATAAPTTGKSDQMPVFLEVIQTTSLDKNSVQSPVIGVGPATYFYDPESKILTVNPSIILESATELIIGVNEIFRTPGQVFEKKEIVQYPSAQPALIQIVAADRASDRLTILFAGEQFGLAPGESRSFKKLRTDSNSSAVITIISNYGRPIEIQPFSSDGSLR